MPQIPIIMPQLGESIAEATIISFLVKAGDTVEADQDLVEVETNKASMNVSSPARGQVQQWVAKADESYAVGEVLGYLEVTKEEAERLGLINRVVAHDDLSAQTAEIAARIAHGPLVSYRYMKANVNLAATTDFRTLLDREAETHLRCGMTEDHQEGVRAFLEKREPNFGGK